MPYLSTSKSQNGIFLFAGVDDQSIQNVLQSLCDCKQTLAFFFVLSKMATLCYSILSTSKPKIFLNKWKQDEEEEPLSFINVNFLGTGSGADRYSCIREKQVRPIYECLFQQSLVSYIGRFSHSFYQF